MLKHYTDTFGDLQTLTKKFGKRQVVVIFTENGKVNPNSRWVWELQDGKLPRELKASYGNKSSINTLEESGWAWSVLKDHTHLIQHMAGMPTIDKLQIAA
jgi:hypothetical protein